MSCELAFLFLPDDTGADDEDGREIDFLSESSCLLPFKTAMMFLIEGTVFTPEVTDFAVFLACVMVLKTAWPMAMLSEEVILNAS